MPHADPAARAAYQRAYQKANRGKLREYHRAYYAENRAVLMRLRRELVGRAGGRCLLCGWVPRTDEDFAAIDFHHAIPAEKKFTVSGTELQRVRSDVLAEAAKCVPLCARCHRIHHARPS